MKKLSLYKNNYHQSTEKLHEDNEQLSSTLTALLDKCSQLTQIKQFDRVSREHEETISSVRNEEI